MSKKKILVVDDEKLIVKGIRFSLEQDDMEVDCAYDGEEALRYAKNCEYDLVLLDVMLPKMDGFQVCQSIREFSDMPIVMLTAKSEDMDKILGLEYGADDYITKPYNPALLLLKIEALFRRLKPQEKQEELEYRGVFLNPLKSTLRYQDREIILSKNEISIFHYLLKNRGKIVSRDELMDYLWDCNDFVDDNTLTVNINRLRKKLEEIELTGVIETRRRQGYILI